MLLAKRAGETVTVYADRTKGAVSMTPKLVALGSCALVAGLLLSVVLVGKALAQTSAPLGISLLATLSDPGNGSGTANVQIDPNARTVCYSLTVSLDPPATAAHIHRGDAGTNGPIVVPFDSPASGGASGCAQGVDVGLIQEIMADPAGFYVNVHNSTFPSGAIRGQLVPLPG